MKWNFESGINEKNETCWWKTHYNLYINLCSSIGYIFHTTNFKATTSTARWIRKIYWGPVFLLQMKRAWSISKGVYISKYTIFLSDGDMNLIRSAETLNFFPKQFGDEPQIFHFLMEASVRHLLIKIWHGESNCVLIHVIGILKPEYEIKIIRVWPRYHFVIENKAKVR